MLLWGPAAVEHHKTCRSLGKSLWQQPSPGDVLRLLDRDRMMKTILHFPQNRRLLPPEVRSPGQSPQGALPAAGGARLPAPSGILVAPQLQQTVKSTQFVNIVLSAVPTATEVPRQDPMYLSLSFHSYQHRPC